MAARREALSEVPTAGAWESRQEEITRFYREEHKTIKQIQQAMYRRHKFFAT
jgi:Clr5 domain